jgi:oligopeptide/dipeptide ABC transporter ATP-binding protein
LKNGENHGRLFLESSQRQVILEVRELTVRYLPSGHEAVTPVNCVHLRVQSGELLGMMGESGSGKSTLAATILKMLPPRAECAGSVLFQGSDLLAVPESEMHEIRGARIAMIPQDPATSLNPALNIGTHISEVLRAHVPLSKTQRRARVLELLREVGFDNPERIGFAYSHELSGGQRQRAVIAQAIACRPALLIADEPTSKLDSPLQAEILLLLTSIARRHGTALILITHDPGILIGIADRIAVMYAGSIVEEGSAEEVVRNPLHPYTQALLRLFKSGLHHDGKIKKFPMIPGEAPDLLRVGLGCRFEPRCSERMPVCSAQDPAESNISHSHRVSCFKHVN